MADPSLLPPVHVVRDAVARALAEDLTPLGDLTSALLPAMARATAFLVPRSEGVLAGTTCAEETFRQLDDQVEIVWMQAEGDLLQPARPCARVSGFTRTILTGERTALNFLGHLSGIATLTSRFVEAAGGGGARIWDTRKTTPGLRALEKAAVRAGGGRNHRGNLSDWVMVKDNHIAVGGIAASVAAARDMWPGRTVQVECDRLDQVLEAVGAQADALLLDNMTPEQVKECVSEVERLTPAGARRCLLEVSGGVTLETVGAYAATGVDQISVGALTNSAPVLDIGLDLA